MINQLDQPDYPSKKIDHNQASKTRVPGLGDKHEIFTSMNNVTNDKKKLAQAPITNTTTITSTQNKKVNFWKI